MKAAIIAAGEGSRLKSEGIVLPKPLVAIDGIPLIERLIATFIRHGITEIACIVNEYSLDVKQFVEQKNFPVPIHFVVKTTPSSMHSLFALAPYVQEGQFLLSTVDSVFGDGEFSCFLQYAQSRRTLDGVLAITDFVDDENPLYVEMNERKEIMRFLKKPGDDTRAPAPANESGKELGNDGPWVTGGLYIFSPRIFREVDGALGLGIERLRNFLVHLIARGYILEGYQFSRIVDVDRVSDLHTAEAWLALNPKPKLS